ncbi:tyrosine-type recombinase/integrase [Agrobacterium sp. S2/73]|nr:MULTISPECIES: site-specific integrase [unclassified Agrobacterium]MBO9108397.1 tyrosine-type recombinase/integrase [Agrobacterium sp. S2/73]NTA10024.1 tyrosine-type recombinase/integrase [Agrobacterium tumefaciens]QXZ71024.1 tyrosine-type recombinase/integrase [Agrobacterium sp. S7/73]
MARHKLNEAKIKKLEKPGIYSDGDGLFMRVRAGGSKQWLFIFKRDGKRTEMGLGGYGQGTAPVSLQLAREKAEVIRERLARGDALHVRVTFLDVAKDYIKKKCAETNSEKHHYQIRRSINDHAAPLHRMPIADITRQDVLDVLRPLWETMRVSADRTRTRIAGVFDLAKAQGLRSGDNPAAWEGGLKDILPANKVVHIHHEAIEYKDMPAVMKKIRAETSVYARAAEFACLTAARSGEVRGAVWSEIDMDAKLWIIPAERMKARKEHRIPLSDRALTILQARKQVATGALVFEGEKEGCQMGDKGMLKVIRAATGGTETLHGLRSTFRDWAGDATHHQRDIIEAALAHAVGNAVEQAYRRSDALEKRRQLMQDWCDYCQSTPVNRK